MVHWVKIPPAVQETQETGVWSLGREDPLEEGLATHSSILAWEAHGQRSLEGYTVPGVTKSQKGLKWLSTHAHWCYNAITFFPLDVFAFMIFIALLILGVRITVWWAIICFFCRFFHFLSLSYSHYSSKFQSFRPPPQVYWDINDM